MAQIQRDISEADFKAFVQYAHDLAGIALGENKKHLLISRLIRRVRALNLADIASYRQYLAANLEAETGNFVNSITTNLTSFFREKYHFDYLHKWLKENPKSQLKVWSAGCSTGQEPYSIGMSLDQMGLLPTAKILATDIDTQCLSKARAGVYRDEDIEDFDQPDRQRWFQKGSGDNSGLVRVKKHLRESVEFSFLNLMDDWPDESNIDVIFCRNVFIYFDAETQAEILKRFAKRLSRQGVLFLGHSEGIRTLEGTFEQVGRTTYRHAS